jgi:hypothetical protein
MAYRPLLELAITHAYLGGDALPGSAVVPDQRTEARLRGLRLIGKPSSGRFRIFGEFDSEGALRVALPAALPLRFAIQRPGPELAFATDMARLGPASLYTDEGAPAGNPQQLRPKPRTKVDDPHPFALAAVELTRAQVAAAAAGRPRRCTVTLPVVTARWCYYLVTDLPNPLSEWSIARGGGANGPAPAFGDDGRVELTDSTKGDSTGAMLRRQNPGLRVLRFLSDAPFAARQAVVRGLELHVGGTRLFGALPNPSPGATVQIGKTAAFSQTLKMVTA